MTLLYSVLVVVLSAAAQRTSIVWFSVAAAAGAALLAGNAIVGRVWLLAGLWAALAVAHLVVVVLKGVGLGWFGGTGSKP